MSETASAQQKTQPKQSGEDPETVVAESDSTDHADSETAASKAADAKVADSEAAGTGAGDASVPKARRRWIIRGAMALVALIAVVATVVAVVLGWKLKDRNDTDTAGHQALTTAQTYAVTLTSIDSQHIDENYKQVLDGATGDFKNMYAQSSGQLKQLLIDNKAVSQGKIVNAGIKSASKDKVEVMLFVDQQVTNSASPQPRLDRSRIVMTMQRVGDRWLVAEVVMA
ncbi:MAG: hypothetical protein J2P18_10670 [Nocardia sp.]|nr:hypothetical protein [Nocardia sp.]